MKNVTPVLSLRCYQKSCWKYIYQGNWVDFTAPNKNNILTDEKDII